MSLDMVAQAQPIYDLNTPNVVLMLGHRLWRWPSINTTLGRSHVCAGYRRRSQNTTKLWITIKPVIKRKTNYDRIVGTITGGLSDGAVCGENSGYWLVFPYFWINCHVIFLKTFPVIILHHYFCIILLFFKRKLIEERTVHHTILEPRINFSAN